MSDNHEANLKRYDELKTDLRSLYRLKIELDSIISWPPHLEELESAKKKLAIVKEKIDRLDIELSIVKGRLPPPPPLNPADDWVHNPDGQSKSFDQEEWLKKQKEAREKARKKGLTFEPDD